MLALRWIRALLLVELVAVLIVASGLWTLQRQTLDGELRSLAALAAAMAAQADGTLETADAALRATRDELANGLLNPGSERTTAVLRARAAALPGYRALAVYDASGRLVASSRQVARESLDVRDRDFFQAASQGLVGGLYVGSPADTALGAVIGVSLPWRAPDGSLRGVVALLAPAEFLDGEFERIAPTADTALAIYRRGHGLVSDGPGIARGHVLPGALQPEVWAQADPARARLMPLGDGRELLLATHRLARHPMAVAITRDAALALADWSEQAWLVGSFAGSALLVTLVLALRAGREQLRRRAAESELDQEQQRAMRAFQAAEEGHWEWDPRLGVSHLSPRMRELMGLPRGTSLASEPALMSPEAVHPDDRRGLKDAFEAHALGRTPAFDFTFRVRGPDGRWRHVRSRGLAWRDEQGAPRLFSGTAVDVSDEVHAREERQQLQDQLQRARQLEALGTLAGGVAHDFNNILAAVLGYGELARDAAPAGSAQARQLDQVLQAGQRGQALVARILSFSRGARRTDARFRVQPVVEEVLQLLAGRLPAGVRLQADLQAPQAGMAGDATAFYEAVMNLATNAIQAMPAGGRLEVGLAVAELAQARSLFSGELRPGLHVRLSVRDSGAGIAPAVMARLFEPFFTTKAPGEGTGLGLAVVRAVVHDLDGAIDVSSVPGQGACFSLYLPCSLQPAAGDGEGEVGDGGDGGDGGGEPPGHGEQVLVVDDDPALVELAEDMLASLGYEPWGLSSPAQALQRLREEPQRFDLLLTDERMPGLCGTELAAAARALRPGLPVIVVSGWGGDELLARAQAAGVSRVLSKPLQRAALARALAQVLARPSGTGGPTA